MRHAAHVAHHLPGRLRIRVPSAKGNPAALEAMKKKVPETMAACFDLIESKMMKGPWVMGDSYTICDPYLFTIAGWLEGDSVDPARFPKVKAHRDHMSQRAAVQRALAAEKA